MKTDNIIINTQSSIKIILDKTIYFDPFQIKDNLYDADLIFITHEHYDHYDIESINKIKNENTIIVAPYSMEKHIRKIDFIDYIFLNPDDEVVINDIKVKAIRAYNINKPFHSIKNNWLGYIITYNNITYYIAGDTDKTIEMEKVKCDIAFLPIGGHFTMDAYEASEVAKIINPKIVIPIHYGSIIGNKEDSLKLKDYLKDTSIEVVIKLN